MANQSKVADANSKITQIRYIVLLFDGTWAAEYKDDSETVVQILKGIFTQRKTVIPRYYPGVGTGLRDKYIGAFGKGVKENIYQAYSDLSGIYQPGDIIIILGYSRGAFTGRSLAGLIDLVGIPRPRPNNSDAYRRIFRAYTSGKLKAQGVAPEMMRQYNSHENVTIGFLGCFDTVGALGIPKTGILGFLNLLKPFQKRLEFHHTNPARNVTYLWHALPLKETRSPFEPTMMHVGQKSDQKLEQIWYEGNHRTIGRGIVEGTNYFDDPLVTLLDRLHEAFPALPFDAVAMAGRIPGDPAIQEAQETITPFTPQPIPQTNVGLWRLMGSSQRTPGQYYKYGYKTEEYISAGVRMREIATGSSAVPGFERTIMDGEPVWHRTGERINTGDSGESISRVTVLEASVGEFQRRLLAWKYPGSMTA